VTRHCRWKPSRPNGAATCQPRAERIGPACVARYQERCGADPRRPGNPAPNHPSPEWVKQSATRPLTTARGQHPGAHRTPSVGRRPSAPHLVSPFQGTGHSSPLPQGGADRPVTIVGDSRQPAGRSALPRTWHVAAPLGRLRHRATTAWHLWTKEQTHQTGRPSARALVPLAERAACTSPPATGLTASGASVKRRTCHWLRSPVGSSVMVGHTRLAQPVARGTLPATSRTALAPLAD